MRQQISETLHPCIGYDLPSSEVAIPKLITINNSRAPSVKSSTMVILKAKLFHFHINQSKFETQSKIVDNVGNYLPRMAHLVA